MSLKKISYLILTMVFLAVFSILFYMIGRVSGLSVDQSVLLAGIIGCMLGGYGLGQYRWRIVYIEKRHCKKCSIGFRKK